MTGLSLPFPITLRAGSMMDTFVAGFVGGEHRNIPIDPPIRVGDGGGLLWMLGGELGVYEPAAAGAPLVGKYEFRDGAYRPVLHSTE